MKLTANISLHTSNNIKEFDLSFSPTFPQIDAYSALNAFFDFTHYVRAKVAMAAWGNPYYFAIGKLTGDTEQIIEHLFEVINQELKLDLRGPFEGCTNLHGNLWEGQKVLNRTHNDAMVQLKFEPDAMDLKSHIHEYSDRVVLIRDGRGNFHPSLDSYEAFASDSIQSLPVEKGTMVIFPKNVVHTFSTMNSDMEMVAYHYPYIPFESDKQYTVTEDAWNARQRAVPVLA